MTHNQLVDLRYHAANGNRKAERLLNKWNAAKPDERAAVEREIDDFLDQMSQQPRRYSPVKEWK